MPGYYQIDEDNGLARIIAEGKLTDSEMLGVSHQLFYDKNFNIELNQLIDLRKVTSFSVTTKGIEQLIAHERHQIGSKPCGKLVIVAPSDISFGTARMYQLLSSDETFTIQVFRNMGKAIEWLGLPCQEDIVERRKHKRFKVKEGAFVEFDKPRFFILDKPLIIRHAPLMDISRCGLAFKYGDREKWSHDYDELAISKRNNEFKIDKVPFQVCSDFIISQNSDSTSMRRCGAKFGDLNSSQKANLYSFMNAHTIRDHKIDIRIGS